MNLQRFILRVFLIVVLPLTSSAQYMPGAKQIALAHADIASVSDVFSTFTNPAGLANINSFQIGIYYSPSPFGLKQLSNGFAGAAIDFDFGALSTCFSTYGFELYKENKISVSYAKKIEENLNAGISVSYNSLSIQNYGHDFSILLSIGITAVLSENLFLGIAAHNLTRSSYGSEDGQIPAILATGFSYKISHQFIIHFALEKEIENPLSLKFGFEYNPIEFINFRFGIMNEPDTFSAGLGILYSYFTIDYAVFTHKYLGLTNQAGLIINF